MADVTIIMIMPWKKIRQLLNSFLSQIKNMKKKAFVIIAACLGCIAGVLIVCNAIVAGWSEGRIYGDAEEIPHNRYGLLPGTSPITPQGTHNYYFDNRIQAADELFKAGKIDYIIVSGGDYRATEKYGCDEPSAMRDSLTARGVPAERIILDYDGTRTIYSIVKAKNIYKIDSVTIISQKYHNERALVQAGHFGIEAVAYNAQEPDSKQYKLKNHIREYFARVRLFIDLARSGEQGR